MTGAGEYDSSINFQLLPASAQIRNVLKETMILAQT